VQLSCLCEPGPLWAATWLHSLSEALNVCLVMLSFDKLHVGLVPQFCSEVKLCNASYTNCRCEILPTPHHITSSNPHPSSFNPHTTYLHVSVRQRESSSHDM